MKFAPLNEFRCKCGRLLFKGVLLTCKLEIKCKRCGGIKTIICSNGIVRGEQYVHALRQKYFGGIKEKFKKDFKKRKDNHGFWFFFISLFLK